MHKLNYFLILALSIFIFSQCSVNKQVYQYKSETLEITQLTKNTYIHISFLNTQTYGKVPCNGLIYVMENNAVVFDTPADNETSKELIKWIEGNLDCKVSDVVVNHFHVDCLGGLEAFHEAGVESYGHELTIDFAKAEKVTVPKHSFTGRMEIHKGGISVYNEYHGPGHTTDNIISYIPKESVIFGGCMIKSLKSGKGNLADANVSEWSNSAAKVKAKHPDIKYVVPGHGKAGGVELLDYTIEMFRSSKSKK